VKLACLLLSLAFLTTSSAREIRVVITLADNATQGIIPVPVKIGNGNDLENNLYWGCSEALKPVLKRSPDWKLVSSEPNVSEVILERCTFEHRATKTRLVADAYRGSAIRQATVDFFGHLTSTRSIDDLPLVAYIGHDGLMDFELPENAAQAQSNAREAIVLCCMSEKYFGPRLQRVGAKPLITTQQLMYPGGFILKAALDGWFRSESANAVLGRAVASYALNQKISEKAARGVFASRP
jgi:hypothetical protein